MVRFRQTTKCCSMEWWNYKYHKCSPNLALIIFGALHTHKQHRHCCIHRMHSLCCPPVGCDPEQNAINEIKLRILFVILCHLCRLHIAWRLEFMDRVGHFRFVNEQIEIYGVCWGWIWYSTACSPRSMIYSTRHSGQIVMESLECLLEPVTVAKIVQFIAIRWRFDQPKDVRKIKTIVRKTVLKGVRHGFIVEKGPKRYTSVGILLRNGQRHVDDNMQSMFGDYVNWNKGRWNRILSAVITLLLLFGNVWRDRRGRQHERSRKRWTNLNEFWFYSSILRWFACIEKKAVFTVQEDFYLYEETIECKTEA